jgi:phage gp36-like protein
MAYASVQDMIVKFGLQEVKELSNLDDPMAEVVNEAIVTRALDDVSARMNGWIASRYDLSKVGDSEVLKAACLDMARYELDKNLQREDVRLRYEDWRDWFRDLARGLVQLDLPIEEQAAAIIGGIQYVETIRIFDSQGLAGYGD